MEVSSNRGTPKSSIWIYRIFHWNPSSHWGTRWLIPSAPRPGSSRTFSKISSASFGAWIMAAMAWLCDATWVHYGKTMGKPWDTPNWWPFHASFHGENHGENVEWCLKPICMWCASCNWGALSPVSLLRSNIQNSNARSQALQDLIVCASDGAMVPYRQTSASLMYSHTKQLNHATVGTCQ